MNVRRSVAALAAVALGAACSVPPPNDPAGVTLGVPGTFAALDPALVTTGMSDAYAARVLETLVSLDPSSFSVVPGLARRWSVAPDGLSWTFELQPGRSFSDGTPVDAAAVVTNFNRWRVTADPHHYGHEYPQYVRYFGGYDAQSVVDGVTATAAYTVVIHTRAPLGDLLRVLTLPAFSIGSPIALNNDRQVYEDVPTGSGPYALAALSGADGARLLRNSSFTGAAPAAASVTLRTVPDPGTVPLVLAQHDVDAVLDPPVPEAAAAVSGARPVPFPSDAVCMLVFEPERAPFDVADVRRAVGEALDRTRIAAAFPGSSPARTWLPPGEPGFDPAARGMRYDPAEARRLLAETLATATPVALYYPALPSALVPHPDIVAQDVAADLAAVGLSVSLVPRALPIVPDADRPGVVLRLDRTRSGDPDEFATALATTWHDLGFAQLVARERTTVDESARAAVLRQLDAYVVAEAGSVPLVHPAVAAVVTGAAALAPGAVPRPRAAADAAR